MYDFTVVGFYDAGGGEYGFESFVDHVSTDSAEPSAAVNLQEL